MQFGPTQYPTYREWYAYTSIYKPRSTSQTAIAPSSSYSRSFFSEPSHSAVPYIPSLASPLDALADSFTTPPAQDPLDELLSGKRAFAAKSVEDILGSMYERESLKYDSIRELDYQSSQMRNRLTALESWQWGFNPQMERVRLGVEQELHDIETNKLKEHVECWRDVTRLKTDLRDALREFNQEKQKGALLGAAPSTSWMSKNSAGI